MLEAVGGEVAIFEPVEVDMIGGEVPLVKKLVNAGVWCGVEVAAENDRHSVLLAVPWGVG